jgi:hypothetical protein
MSERGAVPGADLREQAVRVAGALAELGVTRLVLECAGERRELRPRETDLAGVIARAGGGALRSAAPAIEIRTGTAGLEWACQDPGVAAIWREAVSR